MNKRGLAGAIGATVALIVASIAFAGGEDPAKPAGKSADTQTLAGTEDYVVLTGQDLPSLQKRHKKQLRAFAAHDGRIVTIPFQVDEKNAEGSYCWELGSNIIKDEDDGVFDPNDE